MLSKCLVLLIHPFAHFVFTCLVFTYHSIYPFILLSIYLSIHPTNPCVHTKLVQAAGKVEERVGNETGARHYYGASLSLQPSAPTLLAYAMLEMRSSKSRSQNTTTTQLYHYNHTKVTKLFEEALLLDPRHGPVYNVYNAYGTIETKRGDTHNARQIFRAGILARCTDAASVYHGLAKLELSLGNVENARSVLRDGMEEARLYDGTMDGDQR